MTWPDWTHFASGVVANSDDEVHVRRIRCCELVPAFTTEIVRWITRLFDLLNRIWIDDAVGVTASTVAFELTMTHGRHKGFSHDGACGVASTEKQDIELLVRHDFPL